MKKVLIIAALVIASGGAMFAVSRMDRRPSGTNTAFTGAVGETAPAFALETLGGPVTTLTEYNGKVILLDFWATWDPYSQNEFQQLENHYQKYKDREFVVIGVHRTRTEMKKQAEEFAKRYGVTFPIFFDTTDEVYSTYVNDGRSLPVGVLIDRNGVVRYRVTGAKDFSALDKEIEKLL